VGLRTIDRVGPVDRHRAALVTRFAAPPILWPHMHAKRRLGLLGIGDDMNFVAARRKAVRCPIGAHAYPTLDRRKFCDQADPHRHTSISPRDSRSARSLTNSGPPSA